MPQGLTGRWLSGMRKSPRKDTSNNAGDAAKRPRIANPETLAELDPLLQLFEPEQKEGIAQVAQQKWKGNASHRCLFDPGEQESGVGWKCWSLVPKL